MTNQLTVTPRTAIVQGDGDPIIYQSERVTEWPAPDGTTVTVEARMGRGVVGLSWSRSDRERPTLLALTVDELDGIVAAVRDELDRRDLKEMMS